MTLKKRIETHRHIFPSALTIKGSRQHNNPFISFGFVPTYYDNYDGTFTWTQTGTTIDVNSSIVGAVAWVSSAGSPGTYRRVVRNLGAILSDTKWTLDWQVVQTVLTTPNYFPVIMTSAATGLQQSASDSIGTNLAATNEVVILYGDATASPSVSSGFIVAATIGTTYYYRLQRESATSVKLYIFSDAARTTQISGSPISQTIASTIQNLQYVHHEIHDAVTGQSTSAQGNTLKIYDGINLT